jgi:hypothetical protein
MPGSDRALLLGLFVAVAGCYNMQELRVHLVSPPSGLQCVETVDRVASEAGYARAPTMGGGPTIFYVPKTAPTTLSTTALGWGIGVWMQPHGEHGEDDRCTFELEALGEDPGCGMMCTLSYQRGAEFDQAVQEFARRLNAAFRAPQPGAGAK